MHLKELPTCGGRGRLSGLGDHKAELIEEKGEGS